MKTILWISDEIGNYHEIKEIKSLRFKVKVFLSRINQWFANTKFRNSMYKLFHDS